MSAQIMDTNLTAAITEPGTAQAQVQRHTDTDRRLVIAGKLLKIAEVHDEIWLEGAAVENPEALITRLKSEGRKADIFSFGQKIPDTQPHFSHHFEWDNFAVIPLTTYTAWWDALPQESRRNVRIASKKGAAIKAVEFNDEFVRGISGIYNESPTRQGRKFPHYGKSLETVKKENGTYVERSQFIGAYQGDELIGFIKMVYVDEVASLMQILSKNGHLDKKPMNAMLAKAVELAAERGSKFVVYRKYTYGNVFSALTEFKRRNGFVELKYPRYYIPLTLKGRLAMKLRLHLGLREALPPGLVMRLTGWRSKFSERFGSKKTIAAPAP